jgi:hypothetical protein
MHDVATVAWHRNAAHLVLDVGRRRAVVVGGGGLVEGGHGLSLRAS